MNRVLAVAWMLVMLVGTGCPHAFGREGTIDRAVLKDMMDPLRAHNCDPQEVKAVCGEKFYDECMEECEDP